MVVLANPGPKTLKAFKSGLGKPGTTCGHVVFIKLVAGLCAKGSDKRNKRIRYLPAPPFTETRKTHWWHLPTAPWRCVIKSSTTKNTNTQSVITQPNPLSYSSGGCNLLFDPLRCWAENPGDHHENNKRRSPGFQCHDVCSCDSCHLLGRLSKRSC